MTVEQVMARLVEIHDFMLHHLPGDAQLAAVGLFAPDGRFHIAVDMGGRQDVGEALRDKLAEQYEAKGVKFEFEQTGRRYVDTDRTFTFDTPTERVVLQTMPSDATLAIYTEHPADNEPDVPAGDGETDDAAQ